MPGPILHYSLQSPDHRPGIEDLVKNQRLVPLHSFNLLGIAYRLGLFTLSDQLLQLLQDWTPNNIL